MILLWLLPNGHEAKIIIEVADACGRLGGQGGSPTKTREAPRADDRCGTLSVVRRWSALVRLPCQSRAASDSVAYATQVRKMSNRSISFRSHSTADGIRHAEALDRK